MHLYWFCRAHAQDDWGARLQSNFRLLGIAAFGKMNGFKINADSEVLDERHPIIVEE